MKKTFLFLLLPVLLLAAAFQETSFRTQQKKHSKVKTAYSEKYAGIGSRLRELGVDSNSVQLYIRAFKKDAKLEAWVKSAKQTTWQLYKTYDICAPSGDLGPKRCQGDGQVPEGFYNVNVFNPYSSYYLSLGVSYPNSADRKFACKRDPGGAIMIHGSCVTIGCIPLTDDKIKEVYVLAVEARNAGQKDIPIHIFPARMNNESLAVLLTDETYSAHHAFWKNLKEGYDFFETDKKLPAVTVSTAGAYQFR